MIRYGQTHSNDNNIEATATTQAPSGRAPGNVSTSQGFKDAATQLLRGLDRTVDPCSDFYAFTCNNYLNTVQIPDGQSRIGVYDEAQVKVYSMIADILDQMDLTKVSLTEKITHNVSPKMSSGEGFFFRSTHVAWKITTAQRRTSQGSSTDN